MEYRTLREHLAGLDPEAGVIVTAVWPPADVVHIGKAEVVYRIIKSEAPELLDKPVVDITRIPDMGIVKLQIKK